MKKLGTVFSFELQNYIKNKSFVLTTIIICVVICVVMFLPRVIDMSSILGNSESTTSEEKSKEDDKVDEADRMKLGIFDESHIFADNKMISTAFDHAKVKTYDSEKALKSAVMSEKVDAGFWIKDSLNSKYYVNNSDLYDDNKYTMINLLTTIHKQQYCAENHLDYQKVVTEYEKEAEVNTKILGKNAEKSYWYCYALVIAIFMIIMLYGVMIATSVTTEKSNRSIELLITSVDPKYLLFGKVFAGTVAVVIQVGLILCSAILGYQFNQSYWGGQLDNILDIPFNVLLAFIIFGIGGFLFYAFLYGAFGALVSKTEDINKSAGNLNMVIMLVYFLVLFQLQNIDGTIIKVCSYIPFSSYSAMFARVAMGNVAVWEIIVSAVILYVSIFVAGWLGAKIYRMGTLRYGNPIKITKALKMIRKQS